MSAIKSWNRNDIHESKDNAEESCHLPEDNPVPNRWEHTAYGSKTAEALGAFLACHILEVAHIATEYAYTITATCIDTWQNIVIHVVWLIVMRYRSHAYTEQCSTIIISESHLCRVQCFGASLLPDDSAGENCSA